MLEPRGINNAEKRCTVSLLDIPFSWGGYWRKESISSVP